MWISSYPHSLAYCICIHLFYLKFFHEQLKYVSLLGTSYASILPTIYWILLFPFLNPMLYSHYKFNIFQFSPIFLLLWIAFLFLSSNVHLFLSNKILSRQIIHGAFKIQSYGFLLASSLSSVINQNSLSLELNIKTCLRYLKKYLAYVIYILVCFPSFCDLF